MCENKLQVEKNECVAALNRAQGRPAFRPRATAATNNDAGGWQAWNENGLLLASDKYLTGLTATCLNLGYDVDVLT